MSPFLLVVLFVGGLLVGSFLNVLILRYQPGARLFDFKIIGGRSHCRACKQQLRWYDLFPVLSFLFLRGRCRYCNEIFSWQYPLVELCAALITAFVPLVLFQHFNLGVFSGSLLPFIAVAALWVLIGYALLVTACIDLRYMILPDQINLFIAGLGIVSKFLILTSNDIFAYTGSLAGPYFLLFSVESWWGNLALALLANLVVFGGIIALTRGRGMGMGDLKLGLALALVVGWPDMLFMIAGSFVVGAIYSLALVFGKLKRIKDSVPFGPFLAIAFFLVLVYLSDFLGWYFRLI